MVRLLFGISSVLIEYGIKKKRGKEVLSGLTSGSSGNRWTRYGKTFVWDKFRSDRVWY